MHAPLPAARPETKIVCGDALATLRQMRDNCVHCVVTSPPYFGLRDYGTAKWEGGDPNCDHKQGRPGVGSMGGDCKKCGATRIDAQIGLEPSPQEYVTKLVEIFREVRRVLRSDGTCWLNLGDSYANDGKWGVSTSGKHAAGVHGETNVGRGKKETGLKPKDLIGIPWRVAFALQADGWYLRQDIIWHKPNPMLESVRDRCTKAHEYLFLLTKSEKYYFDATAIAEEANYKPGGTHDDVKQGGFNDKGPIPGSGQRSFRAIRETRNKRSVWIIAPKPYKEAHFATFPPDLVEPCILAGTSEHGCCPQCAAPWTRKFEKTLQTNDTFKGSTFDKGKTAAHQDNRAQEGERYVSVFVGWQPSCKCPAIQPAPCIVMDIFAGAGTTGLVAKAHNRHAILVELNPAYVKLIEKRLA